MARTTGAKNKNVNSINITRMFQEHWASPEKLKIMNDKLAEIIVDGGYRDALSAITQIQKHIMVPAEKILDSETAVETSMSKEDILMAIRSLKNKD